MAKLILLSVLIVTVALPIVFAEHARPRSALRLILGIMVVFLFIWAQLCLNVYTQLVPLD